MVFGLSPSQYVLKAGYKKLAHDTCSLADYNIQEGNTLDILPRSDYHILGGTNTAIESHLN